ncbi:Hypothetical predicted protein [Pelobates cultripes]|uniref:Uncharacterized protein n=1 Tax=Pelobates cultripes TaxID=61616 RepID=A0AAD1R3X8_PELCU|nr:Hypothetical predicted protein [Pelobates cultripes]
MFSHLESTALLHNKKLDDQLAFYPANCLPTIVGGNFVGRITTTTVSLLSPCCLLQNSLAPSSGRLLTIVAASNEVNNIDFTAITEANLPSFFNFSSSRFYLAISTPVNGLTTLVCLTPNNQLTFQRLGNDFQCIINPTSAFCNGPLDPSVEYRVAFLLTNENGTFVLATGWSDVIHLNRANNFSTINTNIKKHSPTMIIITTILPVLLAILLITFTALMFKSCMCKQQQQTRSC